MRRAQDERGIFLLVFAATFFVLLAVLGLAVDIGKLQHTKLRVQRAVDASSIAATHLLQDQSRTVIQDTARQLVTDNLLKVGIPASAIASPIYVDLQPTSGAPRFITVGAAVNTPFVILRMVPGFGRDSVVRAQALSSDKRVAVVLVLDISGSMDQTVPCGNLQNHPPTCTKLDFLKQAAIDFVDLFSAQDRLSIVTFGNAATVAYPMTRNPNKNTISSIVHGLSANGYTNTYGALVAARAQMTSAVNADLMASDSRAIVVVTDGAPFADDEQTNPSIAVPSVPPSCLTAGPTEDQRRKRRYVAAVAQADLARNASMNVFAIGLGLQGTVTTQNCPSSTNGTWLNYQRTDPFQCANHDEIVKNYFLARLTNDQVKMAGNPGGSPVIPPDPDFPSACVPGKAAIAHVHEGQFYQTNDVNDLSPLLQAIGKHINALLTQ